MTAITSKTDLIADHPRRSPTPHAKLTDQALRKLPLQQLTDRLPAKHLRNLANQAGQPPEVDANRSG